MAVENAISKIQNPTWRPHGNQGPLYCFKDSKMQTSLESLKENNLPLLDFIHNIVLISKLM